MSVNFEINFDALNPDFSRFYNPIFWFWLLFGNLLVGFCLYHVQLLSKDRCYSRQCVVSEGRGLLCLLFGQSKK